MKKPKLLIFASGSKDGGGSGFEKLVEATKNGILDAEIVAVVSNHEQGGVRERADRLGIPFLHFPGPWTGEQYQGIVKKVDADYVALSGWLKPVVGLDSRKTFNIHPGVLPRFGGKGMYGHFVHEATIEAYKRGEVTHSAVTMHFVTEGYDEGPKCFECLLSILSDDDAGSLAKRVNALEHEWQPKITNMIVHGEISWDGKNPNSVKGAIFM